MGRNIPRLMITVFQMDSFSIAKRVLLIPKQSS